MKIRVGHLSESVVIISKVIEKQGVIKHGFNYIWGLGNPICGFTNLKVLAVIHFSSKARYLAFFVLIYNSNRIYHRFVSLADQGYFFTNDWVYALFSNFP